MSRETRTSPGWIVVETVKDEDDPSVVFEDGKLRDFSRLNRRTNFATPSVNAAVAKGIATVQKNGAPYRNRTGFPDGTPVHYEVLPIFGPNNAVYGCQVWLGRIDDAVVPPRNVEAYSFDLSTGLTTHGPGVDENILSLESVDRTRPSHDRIFSFYDNFPRLNALGLWIKDIENGLTTNPFQAQVSLTDGRGMPRNIHVSQVNRISESGNPELRGLLHEITDIEPHTTNYALALAKSLAAKDDPAAGRALVDLTTGIILDWINSPRDNLEPWSREMGLFTNRGQQQAAALRQRVLTDRSLKYVEKPTQVRFGSSPHDEWIDVVIGYEHHGDNQGIMTVREAK